MEFFKVKNLKKKYGDELIFENVNFTLPSKGIIGLVGESGSGKSTLLKCLMGIESPDEGEVFFEGKKIKDFANFRNNDASIVYQNYNLISFLNGYQNITLGTFKKVHKKRIFEVASFFNIENKLFQKIDTLSGGEKQRIALARAYIAHPKIIFCDEPTGSLDEENADAIMEKLKKISKDCLVFLITHNNEYLSRYCNGYLKIENKTVKKIYVSHEDKVFVDKKKKINHLSCLKALLIAFKILIKNKTKSFISLLSLGFSICFLLLSLNASSSLKTVIKEKRSQYLDYNLVSIYVESSNKLENSNFSLIQMEKPNRLDLQYLSPFFNVNEYRIDIRPVFGLYPNINFPLGSDMYYSNIEFVPCSRLMMDRMSVNIQGNIPLKANSVIINEPASLIIKGNRFYIDASKEIDYKLDNNQIITDSYSLKMNFEIVGKVHEFSLFETPKIYYSYDLMYEYLKNITLDNLSIFYEEEVSLIDRLNDYTLENDSFASHSLLIEINDIDRVYEKYIQVQNLKVDKRKYVLENDSLNKVVAFEEVFVSIEEVILIFVSITIIISILLLSLCLFSFIQDHKKDIGILFSLGICKFDIIKCFFLLGLLIATCSFFVSFGGFFLISSFLNQYLIPSLGIAVFSFFPSVINILFVFLCLFIVVILSNFASTYGLLKINLNEIIKED
ncbi:MAG: ATP-binding cassette domain-containing protein [Bacillales bacterium]|nr:ATP-binding cassette domain-containing protein [Bacillales bacterium]